MHNANNNLDHMVNSFQLDDTLYFRHAHDFMYIDMVPRLFIVLDIYIHLVIFFYYSQRKFQLSSASSKLDFFKSHYQ